MQSRNFRLQRVGDIEWLECNYKFQKISFSLDELIVLDATKSKKDIKKFSEVVSRLVKNVFIPVAAGGGICSLENADLLFRNGADKVVLNTALYEDPALARDIIETYGAQSLVACVDYRILEGRPVVFTNNGETPLDMTLQDYLAKLEDLGVGEILLNSIDMDGTGFGYDILTIKECSAKLTTPLIIMGGAGNEKHLLEGGRQEGVSATATANLFNFIGNGLPNARKFLLESGENLARWQNVN